MADPRPVIPGFEQHPAVAQALRARVGAGGVVPLDGVAPAAHAAVISALRGLYPGRALLVVADTARVQETLHADLTAWLGGVRPPFLPAWDTLPDDGRAPHADIVSERLESLVAAAGAPPVVVASVVALQQATFTPAALAARTRILRRGDTVNPLDLVEWLEEQGYEPEAQVTGRGELSWRGGIVDVWPLTAPWPLRLEFFGEEVESLREFDPHRQTSRDPVDECLLPPAGEPVSLRAASDATTLELAGPAEHFPADVLVVLPDPEALEAEAGRHFSQVRPGDPFHRDWAEVLRGLAARGATVVHLSETGAIADPGSDPLRFESLDAFRPVGAALPDALVAEEQRRAFFVQMLRWLRRGFAVDVLCANDGECQRFGELWAELCPGAEAAPEIHGGSLARGFLNEAARRVVVSDAEIYGRYKVSRPRRLKSPHARAIRSAFEVDFADFEEGDTVVHLEHGIGVFRGLRTPAPPAGRAGEPAAGDGRECLVIEYAAPDGRGEPPRLYVPVTEAHLVGKYVGVGKARPQLSTLGGSRWSRAKEQAGHAVRDLAAELLAVQAARVARPGHAFAPDNAWQREFEASFEFEETPDQSRAVAAVKADMESPRPMDRLLCGDVGFGKTEVAIRAAFKAVMGGKQVALLVPTTVLAQQHYNSLRERLASYPVRVELLSRFRTAREQRAVMEAAAAGAVDIVIGTHRIVSPDMRFRDLGLVVVDEEQKFGVRHKERFKLLRETVDVLTLSATPIPRTLHLALTGARDLGTLETPPQDRLPVETIVCDHDDRVVRDAIRREMNRGGQTYYLHNRVATIESVAHRLRDLLPGARILVGHGQMADDDLEEVMTRFVNGEADVLVSTTIIESGLDIPNANTILIDRADRFGLSELYQLRGRVGRHRRQAWCYLLLPRHARLLTSARRRMSAIRQYSALGSGFKIAMRDLEIRGAGNILGARQSGHIAAVGFDLYCRLLGRSVAALKGSPAAPRAEVRMALDFLAAHPGEERPAGPRRRTRSSPARPVVDIPRDDGVATLRFRPDEAEGDAPADDGRRHPAYLPLDYVREPALRVEVYRRLAGVADAPGLETLRAELRDRFGPLPTAADLLLRVHDLRLLAASRGVTSVEVAAGKVKLTRNGDLITVGGQFPRLARPDAPGRLAELRRLLLSLG